MGQKAGRIQPIGGSRQIIGDKRQTHIKKHSHNLLQKLTKKQPAAK